MTDAQLDDLVRVEDFASEIANLHPTLRAAAIRFLEKGEIDETLTIHGYTLKRIQEEQQVGILGAFTFLDGLIVHPEQTLRNMQHPHDRIVYADTAKKTTH